MICCLDDSDGARHALSYADELAKRLGLELLLLHVEPPTEAPGVSAVPAGQERLREKELRDGESLLSRLAREADLDPAVRHRTVIGNAGQRVVEVCAEEGASLVVLGSRGRGGVVSALLGSVSSEVAAKAPCACVVVPPTTPERPAFA